VKLFRFSYENSIPLVYQNGTKNLSVAMVVAINVLRKQERPRRGSLHPRTVSGLGALLLPHLEAQNVFE